MNNRTPEYDLDLSNEMLQGDLADSLDDLLAEAFETQYKKNYLHIMDGSGSMLRLGEMTIIDRNTVRVNFTPDAEPYIGNTLGADFDSLVDKETELLVSPLRLANALGLNINNNNLLSQQVGTEPDSVSLHDVVKLAKQQCVNIMISDSDNAPEHDITIIPAHSVFTSVKNTDDYFDHVAQNKDKSGVFFIRNSNYQLVMADVVVMKNDGSDKANNLVYQHAASQALAAKNIPVPVTQLLKSSDGTKVMLIKARDGAVPFSVAKNDNGDFQTKTKFLHQMGGFCSIDRLRCIISGDLEQHPDASAKLISMSLAKSSLLAQTIPLVMFNHLAGGAPLSSNTVGVKLSQDATKRITSLSFNCELKAPVQETNHLEHKEVTLADLAAVPSLGFAINQHPVIAENALSIAKEAVLDTRSIMNGLEQAGYCSKGFTASLQLGQGKPIMPELSQETFIKSDSALSRFAQKFHREKESEFTLQ